MLAFDHRSFVCSISQLANQAALAALAAAAAELYTLKISATTIQSVQSAALRTDPSLLLSFPGRVALLSLKIKLQIPTDDTPHHIHPR